MAYGAPSTAESSRMTQDEARQAILAEWAALPLVKRISEHQAAVFAIKAMQRFEFRCFGDRYQTIKGWLVQTQSS
jgi:hypothetical protein